MEVKILSKGNLMQSTENRKLRVFILHASQDKPVVREIYQRLLAEDWIDPWLDEEKLLPGQDWDLEIEKTVRSADAVIVCLSSNSVTKEGYVQKEIRMVLNMALEKPEGTVYIIPVRFNDCDIPRSLGAFQYVDFFPKRQRERALEKLLKSLHLRADSVHGLTDSMSSSKNQENIAPSKKWIVPVLSVIIVLTLGWASLLYSKNQTDLPIVSPSPTVTVSSTFAPPSPTHTKTPSSTPSLTPAPKVGSTRISEIDGMLMVYVPEGEFIMGSNKNYPDEKPEHKVYLDSFWIAQTEVTNAMYNLCITALKCNPPSRTDYYSRDASSSEYPVVFISWNDAKAYCEWSGGRLPTEAEWEKAARGKNGFAYPWGNSFECGRGNFDDETGEDAKVVTGGPNCDGFNYIAPVASFPNGKSIYGALDMAGNVWEWVSDWYSDSYYYQYAKSPGPNPTGPETGERRVVKGGAWLIDVDVQVRGSNRYSYPPELVDDNVGFRCVIPEK